MIQVFCLASEKAHTDNPVKAARAPGECAAAQWVRRRLGFRARRQWRHLADSESTWGSPTADLGRAGPRFESQLAVAASGSRCGSRGDIYMTASLLAIALYPTGAVKHQRTQQLRSRVVVRASSEAHECANATPRFQDRSTESLPARTTHAICYNVASNLQTHDRCGLTG